MMCRAGKHVVGCDCSYGEREAGGDGRDVHSPASESTAKLLCSPQVAATLLCSFR